MVDWGKGRYELTAAELAPVAEAVVAAAAPQPNDRVLDIACGTGNAALLAAARGAAVIGVDASERLVDVARGRASAVGVRAEFLVGDLLALPATDASVDIVLSVFGVIFAPDPARAVSEVARVLDAGGRAYASAWVPSGPILEMVCAFGRVMGEVTGAPPPERFDWSDSAAIAAIAGPSGLAVQTTRGELEVRAPSPAAYVDAGREHPMAIDAWPLLERAGVVAALREEMIEVLAAANEDPDGLLLHSPYVVHEMRPPA
ncbi:MAG: class I SAM-dependent methyltransferase [Actinomycetota bacterium]|nr:class I SAM-dependent methyltransferase [Actinomycetota bacterium]